MSKPVSKSVTGGRSAFFENAESDRLLAMLVQMMTEHWALKERVLSLEALLAKHDILPADAVESYVPEGQQDGQWDLQSFEFIQSVIGAARNVDNRNRGPNE